jgi:hypothetical protein
MSEPIPGRDAVPPREDREAPEGGRRAARSWWLAIGLIALYAVAMAWIAQHRVVGNYLKETDFYHLYAPDADRIRSGPPPASTCNTGPAYPLFLALAFR